MSDMFAVVEGESFFFLLIFGGGIVFPHFDIDIDIFIHFCIILLCLFYLFNKIHNNIIENKIQVFICKIINKE